MSGDVVGLIQALISTGYSTIIQLLDDGDTISTNYSPDLARDDIEHQKYNQTIAPACRFVEFLVLNPIH